MKRKPLELVVLQGGGRGARHSLTAPHVVLGRLDPYETATFGNLLFPEPTVSRIHATLDWDEGANRYLLTHRSATNPTIINRVKVSKPRHVSPGDKIQMGNLILEIRVGIGQHAEVELATVDFTALTKQAANQVYRPESVMPEPPAVPAASPQPPQEAPIPEPIPPPARRQLPSPVFHEPYAPVEVAAAAPKAVAPFLEFPEPDEQVSVVREAPRRIQLSSLPRQDEPEVPADSNPTRVIPLGLFQEAKKPAFLPLTSEPIPSEEAVNTVPNEPLRLTLDLAPSGTQESEEPQDPVVAMGQDGGPTEDLEIVPGEPGPGTELVSGEAEEAEVQSDEPGPVSEPAPGDLQETQVQTDPPGSVSELALDKTEEAGVPDQETGADSSERGEAPPEAAESPKAAPFRREARKVGRNEKCPCGSGKKYKKCCGK